jgi:hypothetical protein
MRVIRGLAIGLVTMSVMLAGCGGDGATAASGEADGTMSATVSNSADWRASRSVTASLRHGELSIEGIEHSGRSVTILLVGVELDANNPEKEQTISVYGQALDQPGFARFSEGASNNFSTTQAGGSGTFTITRLTPTRAVGTFTFTAVRSNAQPGAPGTQDLFRRLMGGKFDVRLQ